MSPMKQGLKTSLHLNKNIYDNRGLLIWPAYTPVGPKLLETAKRRGIRISEEDLESGNQALLQAADIAYEELGGIFRSAGGTGKVNLGGLRSRVIPMLVGTLSSGTLTFFLAHLSRKDDLTLRHSVGVAALSIMLGRWLRLPEKDLGELAAAALLHDIGKLRIDRRLLAKPGKLTAGEYETIKRHTVYGYEMLQRANGVSEAYALVALRHHERLDGTGYPHGLKQDELEPFSRIVAITDVFHAMSSKRAYKERLPFFRVIREMHASAFGQFDPYYAFTFLRNIMELLIGTEVVLSNGEKARIVSFATADPLLPLVHVNGRFLDLSRSRHLQVVWKD